MRTFIESGVSLDALVSRDLLCSIFHPGGTLHDGAVIIQGDRISAAACFLPLTTNPLLITELGTRHRAALGISEESDCIAIVVLGRDRQGFGGGLRRNRAGCSAGTRGAFALRAAGPRREAQPGVRRRGAAAAACISPLWTAWIALSMPEHPMIQLFTRNLGWKLLSLLIAIGLWMAVAREPEVATSLSVPVDFKNMRDDLDISGNLPDRVRLEVRGPSGRLTRDNLSTVAVVLDLSDAQPGERTYSIRGRNLNLPSGVVFYRAVPSQLTLHFDQLILKKNPSSRLT